MDEKTPFDGKRMALFLVASLGALYAWSLVAPAPPPPPPAPAAAASSPLPEAPAAAHTVAASAPLLPGVGFTPAISESAPRRLQLQVGQAQIEISNVGGRITSWKLIDHGEYGAPQLPVEMVRRRLPPAAAGTAPEVQPQVGSEVEPAAPGTFVASDDQDVLPLQVRTGDAALDATLARAVHLIELETENGNQVVTMSWSDGAGTSVRKRLVFQADPPLTLVDAQAWVQGIPRDIALLWGPGFANHSERDRTNTYLRRGLVRWQTGGEVEDAERPDKADDLRAAPLEWAALEDSFFTVIFIPSATGPAVVGAPRAGFELTGQLVPDAKGKTHKKDWPEELVLVAPFPAAAPTQALYVGPRERKVLAAVEGAIAGDQRLGSLLHGGMLDPIMTVMHRMLIWLYGHVGSWGVAIVLLTLIIKAVMFPLTHISLKKTRSLAEKTKPLRPRLKALQEKYRKLPRTTENLTRSREEQAALYAEAGVSPTDTLAGCLPVLLSFPFFLALLKLLPNAPEFRHEPFLWWPDLSSGDPTHVWPILMAVTMFVSTKLGMSSAPEMDPMQRNMFLVLPLVFTVFCWSAPLGLVVYWTVSNVVQIGQQYLLKLTLPPLVDAAPVRAGRRPKEPGPMTPAVANAATDVAKSRKKGRKR